MSAVGLLALNTLFALAGLAIFWAIRGWSTWREVFAHLGLAYMLGLAAVGVLATLALVAGFGLSFGTVLVLVAVVVAVGTVVAWVRHSPRPHALGSIRAPRTLGEVLAAAGAASTALVALAMLRGVREQPLVAYDAWDFWVAKAKVIYFFGGIDGHLFSTLPNPSYPLFVPALDAMVFRFVGSADPSALAVQNWFLFVGFVCAAAGILSGIARRGLVWLSLALTAVIPEIEHRWYQLLGDWTLDVFFVLSALLLLRWLRTHERWPLAALPFTFAAMLAAKQEGQLLAACLFLGVAVATVRERRKQWPKPLFALGVEAYAVNIPWRLWWTGPRSGGVGQSRECWASCSRTLTGFSRASTSSSS